MNEKIAQLLERENLKPASLQSRVLAYIFDIFLIVFVVLLIFWDEVVATNVALNNGKIPEDTLQYLTLGVFIFSMIYETLFSMMYGATLGKIVMKIRIINIDFVDKPSFLQSLARAFLKYVGSNLFYLTYIPAFGDVFKRAFHDRILKTLVISS